MPQGNTLPWLGPSTALRVGESVKPWGRWLATSDQFPPWADHRQQNLGGWRPNAQFRVLKAGASLLGVPVG